MAQPTQAGPRKAVLAISLVLGLLVLVVAVVTVRRLSPEPVPRGSCAPLEVSVSTEKDEILADMARRYNEANREVQGIGCAQVSVHGLTSGTAATDLRGGWEKAGNGLPAPQVWLPSTSLWLRKMTIPGAPSVAVTDDPPSLMSSPVALAMPKPMADVLLAKYPRPGWGDFLAFAKQPWEAYGHPEWKNFVLARDNPLFSSSGLGATVATYHAAAVAVTGAEPTETTVDDPRVESFVHDVESSVQRYGEDAAAYAVELFEQDRAGSPVPYISAMVMQEQLVHLYNVGVPDADPAKLARVGGSTPPAKPNRPLTAIYPKDGTVVFDHPFIVLKSASPAQRTAAEDFRRFLLEDAQRAQFDAGGFRGPLRAGEQSPGPTGQLRQSLGLPEAQSPLRIDTPSSSLLNKMVQGWQKTRKQARVLVVLDVSGSMNELAEPDKPGSPGGDKTRLDRLKPAVTNALGLLADTDLVSLWTFSTGYTEVVPLGQVSAVRPRMEQAIAGLRAQGNTDLYATVAAAQQKMAENIDPNSINAIVLLSDGANFPENPAGRQDMLNRISAELNESSVRIFTIPYGSQADTATMVDIARSTKAVSYDASDRPLDIDDVFVSAFSNF